MIFTINIKCPPIGVQAPKGVEDPKCYTEGRRQNKKNVSIWALPELGGGGVYPCPNFFAPFFYLRKKSRQWSRRRKESVKLPELGGGGGVWLIRAMPELKRFFCSDVVPNMCTKIKH